MYSIDRSKKLDTFNPWSWIQLLTLIFGMCGCYNKEDVTPKTTITAPTVESISIQYVDWNFASFEERISDGGSQLQEVGFVWSTNPNPTVALSTKHSRNDLLAAMNFYGFARDLAPDTKYYLRGYATNSIGINYSTEISFITLSPGTPRGIGITSLKNVSSSSAVVDGSVDSDHGSPVLAAGIVWNTSISPDIALSAKTVDGKVGYFTSNITGLVPQTTYYYRAYATNAFGTAYSQEYHFSTPAANVLSVSTVIRVADYIIAIPPPLGSGNPIRVVSVEGEGNISDDGGSLVTQRGFEWSTGSISAGAGAGKFITSLTSYLTPGKTYYVRAYATNSLGTAYGESVPCYVPK